MKSALWLLVLIPLSSFAATDDNNKSLDSLMSQWLSLERQKGGLQTEWNTRREQLDHRLELLDDEQAALREAIAQKSETRNEVDERRLALLESQEKLEKEQALVESQLQHATASAIALKPRLPPPLQSEWQQKMALLENPGTGNSEKLDRLLTLFKLVEEFDNRVALNRSTMELPGSDGQARIRLVTQIYLGAGQGWYVSDDGKSYGYGRATKLGWNWWHGKAASEELGRELDPQALLRLRSILERPTTAEFLSLPIKVQQQ